MFALQVVSEAVLVFLEQSYPVILILGKKSFQAALLSHNFSIWPIFKHVWAFQKAVLIFCTRIALSLNNFWFLNPCELLNMVILVLILQDGFYRVLLRLAHDLELPPLDPGGRLFMTNIAWNFTLNDGCFYL